MTFAERPRIINGMCTQIAPLACSLLVVAWPASLELANPSLTSSHSVALTQ